MVDPRIHEFSKIGQGQVANITEMDFQFFITMEKYRKSDRKEVEV
jgi:hypothetical protein